VVNKDYTSAILILDLGMTIYRASYRSKVLHLKVVKVKAYGMSSATTILMLSSMVIMETMAPMLILNTRRMCK
jgi:hypothetical protein